MNNTKIKILFSIICVSLIQINLYSNHIVKKANENKITDSEYSETDPELIVNPLDENNLISSSLQHKLSYGKDNFVNAISYSFDKGLTWHRYKELITPENEKYRILNDASDNILAFDNNGIAHLAWSNTLIKSGFGGIDSVIQKIIYRYSDDKGQTWKSTNINFGRTKSNYDVNKKQNGLKEQFKNLKFIDYNDALYLTYSIHGLNYDTTNIIISSLKEPYVKMYISLPDSFSYMSNYDLKIKDDKAYITFLSHSNSWPRRQTIEYYVYDLINKKIENSQRINEFNFMGTTYLPYVLSYALNGLPVEKITPLPKINFIQDTCLITWTGCEYTFGKSFPKNNIYLCKGVNNIFEVPRNIYNDTINHQFNYDIKINDSNIIIIHFYNLLIHSENIEGKDFKDYDVEPKFMLSFDNGNTFSKPYSYISQKYQIYHTTRNFNYGIGYKTSISINQNDIFLTWTDGRIGDGNTEIYSAIYPIYFNFEELIKSKSISIEVNSIYPNPFDNKICIKIKNLKLQKIDIDLYDFNGKLVSNLYNGVIKVGDNELILNVERFAEGNYFIKFKTLDDHIVKKIIKVH